LGILCVLPVSFHDPVVRGSTFKEKSYVKYMVQRRLENNVHSRTVPALMIAGYQND
jgi:hypothetical protein